MALKVMLEERAWFRTLDEKVVQRIADTAPEGRDERDYALDELDRRAENRRPPAPVEPLPESHGFGPPPPFFPGGYRR